MGCAHNQADSDAISSVFLANGAKVVDYVSSNVIFINSCTVKTPSEEKAIYQSIKGLESGKLVILGGCVSQAVKQLKRLD